MTSGNGAPARRDHADIARERLRTYEPARMLYGLEPINLVALAEARAGIAPVRNLARRDFVREAAEEFADGRNYLVWLAAQVDLDAHLNVQLAELVRAKVAQAVGGTALVFEIVEELRVLMAEWVHT